MGKSRIVKRVNVKLLRRNGAMPLNGFAEFETAEQFKTALTDSLNYTSLDIANPGAIIDIISMLIAYGEVTISPKESLREVFSSIKIMLDLTIVEFNDE